MRQCGAVVGTMLALSWWQRIRRSVDRWPAALEGVEEVHHVASPIPSAQPKDPDELIVPAREGTVRVLRAARDAGARRVVLTSSFAAVGYSPKAVRDYTEEDWTDPDTPGLPPYPRSKAIAERAAWDFIGAEGGDTELVVMNPTFIAGPSLVSALRSSLSDFKSIIEGTMPALPRQRFGVVDVRDVANAHITAMATPAAAGKRYLLLADGPTITWLGWHRSSATTSGLQASTSQPKRRRRGPLAADDPQRPRQAGTRLATPPGRDHDRRDRRKPERSRPPGQHRLLRGDVAVRGLAGWCMAHHRRVVFAWVGVAIGATVLANVIGSNYVTVYSLPGTQSQQAYDLLAKEFKAQSGDADTIVFHVSQGTIDSPAVRAAIMPLLTRAASFPHVTGVVSPYRPPERSRSRRIG